jgi:hypothetical protein
LTRGGGPRRLPGRREDPASTRGAQEQHKSNTRGTQEEHKRATGLCLACARPMPRLRVALGGSARLFRILHSAFCLRTGGGLVWPRLASQGSKFEVRGSEFGAHHKPSEYDWPPAPPRGGLGAPWTYPGTIGPPQNPIFNQAGLSNSLSWGFSAVKRCPGLDVGCWMLDVRPPPPQRE